MVTFAEHKYEAPTVRAIESGRTGRLHEAAHHRFLGSIAQTLGEGGLDVEVSGNALEFNDQRAVDERLANTAIRTVQVLKNVGGFPTVGEQPLAA